jgi:hypothetical protein
MSGVVLSQALAISGLSVVGRDRYGVFPLRGKLLNVRDATHEQIMNNVEINAIKQILGLQHGKTYTDVKALRYVFMPRLLVAVVFGMIGLTSLHTSCCRKLLL